MKSCSINRFRFFIFTVILLCSQASRGDAKIEADISFLVVDLKYNQNDGVKICEIQQGLRSAFVGGKFFWGRHDYVAEKLCAILEQYFGKCWYVNQGIFGGTRLGFSKREQWKGFTSLKRMLKDKNVKLSGKSPVYDRAHLNSYHGLFVVDYKHAELAKLKKYNGCLLLDNAFMPCYGNGVHADKLLLSRLFEGCEALTVLKPKWNAYQKGYSEDLVKKILEEFSSEYLVIKPRDGMQGKGVIIFEREELAGILEYIFSKSAMLSNDPDKGFWYWANDQNSEFIVEEFFPSDPVSAPHLGNGLYDATMRVAIVFTYGDKNLDMHFLYSMWKLPKLPLDGNGSLNDKHKSDSWSDENYALVDPDVQSVVFRQLEEGLSVMYRNLLLR